MESRCEWIITSPDLTTRVRAVQPGIFRITRTKRGRFLPGHGPASVLDGTTAAGFDPETNTFANGNALCRLSENHALTFTDAHGHALLSEPDKAPCLLNETPVILHRYHDSSDERESTGANGILSNAGHGKAYVDRMAYECRQNFVFSPDEALYGLGSHEEGIGNLRGCSRLLYQHNLKAVVPFLVSTKGWGVLFDMGCMMAFHDDQEGSYLWADCADELDWYFLYGDGSYASLMALYRSLTGPALLLPLYAFGYIQSKERYQDADEILSVAREYRKRRIPLDMMVLDWQSWPEGQWGWKRFDRSRFPDPAGFIKALHEMKIRLMISVWPSMRGETNEDRKEMLAKGLMLGDSSFYNALDPEARRVYWRQAEKDLFRSGVDAWWCDDSEPFESDWHGAIKPEPFRRALINTEEAKRYLDPTKLSLFSLYHSKGIYEGQRGAAGEKRVCNLTRSSWAGQHRYAAVTWSGDVSATWETLRRHVPEGLNFCAAGENWWTCDIGAFFPNSDPGLWFVNGDFDAGTDDPGYCELVVRWTQYAAFLPMMRSHGTFTPREIWRFGEPGGPFYDAIENAIRLRYALLPYIYTLAEESCRTGLPMLRVPALVFPDDPLLRTTDDEMMLGDRLLIRPVTRPMHYAPGGRHLAHVKRKESVYLPKGHAWYNAATVQRFEGGQRVETAVTLDEIPLFIRSGSILPLAHGLSCTDELREAEISITVYPGENGCACLYMDAGDGYGYERGECERIALDWDDRSGVLTVHAREGSYPGMPTERSLLIGRAGEEPSGHIYNGQALRIVL